MKPIPQRLAYALLGRIILVFLLTTLCSFVALDRPVLRDTFLAVGGFLNFLVHFGVLSTPVLATVWNAYWRSLILLVAALGLGCLLGIPLGFLNALRPHTLVGRLAGLLSYLGTLTPSFLLALVIMVFFVRYLGYWTGLQWILILPSPGLPEPREVLAPALTLAARPIAYISQVAAANVRDQLRSPYVQTAYGKGLASSRVLLGHLWPNVAVQILGAARSSLLFSMSSLPIVEYVFGWNGVGASLFEAVVGQRAVLAAFLLVSLGATFILVETLIEVISQRIDPRLGLAPEA